MSGTSSNYAGDLTPLEAWNLLSEDPRAQLVDVRTQPEWAFVGVPDLSQLGRDAHMVEWQSYPSMQVDPGFVDTVIGEVGSDVSKETPILMLCRSGARSRSAAIALTQAGYSRAYNISEGFEGGLDEQRHRGVANGWKAAGLPWRQG